MPWLNYCHQPNLGSRVEHATLNGFYSTQYIYVISSGISVFWATWTNKSWQNPGDWQNSSFLLADNTWTLLGVILRRCALVITERRNTLSPSALGRGEHLGLQWAKQAEVPSLWSFGVTSACANNNLFLHQWIVLQQSLQLWLRGQLSLAVNLWSYGCIMPIYSASSQRNFTFALNNCSF